MLPAGTVTDEAPLKSLLNAAVPVLWKLTVTGFVDASLRLTSIENPLESLSYIEVVPELIDTLGPGPPPPPPPEAAPTPNKVARAKVDIPTVGTAALAVIGLFSNGKYFELSSGIDVDIGESPKNLCMLLTEILFNLVSSAGAVSYTHLTLPTKRIV